MVAVPVLVDVLVVASTLAAPAAVRGTARPPGRGPHRARYARPGTALAAVVALILVNQVLFTVYVERVHGGDPSFVARYLPPGWFATARGNPLVEWVAGWMPAPRLLAPTVLHVQAFLELPLVMLAYAAVLRWLDRGLYRGVVRSPAVWLASASWTAVFCIVEWDLRNPWTTGDILIRLASAVVTPFLLRALAASEGGGHRPESAVGLLAFCVSSSALGYLVLVLYDTVLLYNLGKLGDRLPGAAVALAVLGAARLAAARLDRPAAPGVAVIAVGAGLRWSLTLFFVPALVVRYGVTFGTPLLAAGAGLLIGLAGAARAVREAVAARPGGGPVAGALVLLVQLGAAVGAGGAAGYAAAHAAAYTYYEAALLRAAAAFLVTALAVCALTDAARGTRRPAAGGPDTGVSGVSGMSPVTSAITTTTDRSRGWPDDGQA